MVFLRYSSISSLLCILAIFQYVQALNCADDNKPTCQSDSDCADASNLQGLNQACGDLSCVAGTCQFEAWNNAAPCAQTNYLYCRGDDTMCIKGPTELNDEGTCTGFQNEECVYRWCPGDFKKPATAEQPTTDSTTGTLSPTIIVRDVTENTTFPDMSSSGPSDLLTPTMPPAECRTPCAQTSDCEDANNVQGLNSACGELSCVAGTCQFQAWGDDGDCLATNFLECGGNDALCTKGPSELNFDGTCTGYEGNECVYRWCPGDVAAAASSSSSTSSPPPAVLQTQCSIPCTQDSDCNDPTNAQGLDRTCGDLVCVMGACQFEAWNNAAPCAQTNYLYCRGKNEMCIKGPTELNYEGSCTGFQNDECVYRWCPGDLKSAITDSSTNATDEPPAPNTETNQETDGFTGQAFSVSSLSTLSLPNLSLISLVLSLTLGWC